MGALRPQTPDQGDDLPGPSLGEAACKNTSNKRRLRRWGLRKLDGFWPKKAGKIPGKKLAFSSGLFPGFPRMLRIRVGRQRRPGQKQKTAKFCYPFQCNSGNQAVSTHQIRSAGEGAGDHPLPRGRTADDRLWTNLGRPPVAEIPSEVRSTEREQSLLWRVATFEVAGRISSAVRSAEREQSPHEGELRPLRLRNWGRGGPGVMFFAHHRKTSEN